ncbi:hypothetical protein Hanom_Chr08g00701801 [Helianthus anomalus]
MVPDTGSELISNFPNQLDFRYRRFAFLVSVFTFKYWFALISSRTVTSIFDNDILDTGIGWYLAIPNPNRVHLYNLNFFIVI